MTIPAISGMVALACSITWYNADAALIYATTPTVHPGGPCTRIRNIDSKAANLTGAEITVMYVRTS